MILPEIPTKFRVGCGALHVARQTFRKETLSKSFVFVTHDKTQFWSRKQRNLKIDWFPFVFTRSSESKERKSSSQIRCNR